MKALWMGWKAQSSAQSNIDVRDMLETSAGPGSAVPRMSVLMSVLIDP